VSFTTKSGKRKILTGRRLNPVPIDTCFGRTVAYELLDGQKPQIR
jgi:hypothetical protein